MAQAILDTSTDRGKHVERRLHEDGIGWLTTVRPSGQPDSVPVWFLWNGETILIYSQPQQTKMHNLAHNPKVTFTIDGTNDGSDVIRIEGVAQHDEAHPRVQDNPAFIEKYADGIRRIGYAPEEMGNAYSAAIIITPTRFRI